MAPFIVGLLRKYVKKMWWKHNGFKTILNDNERFTHGLERFTFSNGRWVYHIFFSFSFIILMSYLRFCIRSYFFSFFLSSHSRRVNAIPGIIEQWRKNGLLMDFFSSQCFVGFAQWFLFIFSSFEAIFIEAVLVSRKPYE